MDTGVKSSATNSARREEILRQSLGFGRYFTDHMYTMRWSSAAGWHDGGVRPFAPFELSPAAHVFHYGQAIFEGQKAYPRPDGEICMFRPDANARRFAQSAERMAMAVMPEELYIEALNRLLDVERNWVPRGKDQSLYIRPLMIADEAMLGIRPSSSYQFAIILSPVGSYYENGFAPVRILVSKSDVRAARGGTGSAKAAGNYGASLRAIAEAKAAGCAQVLWLDAVERRFVEEVGAMNIVAVLGGTLVTPPLEGTILAGITRDSLLTLAADKGIPVEERRLDVSELLSAIETGHCSELFTCGTAAVVTSVSALHCDGKDYRLAHESGPLARMFFKDITDIQYGRAEDVHGWCRTVPRRSAR